MVKVFLKESVVKKGAKRYSVSGKNGFEFWGSGFTFQE